MRLSHGCTSGAIGNAERMRHNQHPERMKQLDSTFCVLTKAELALKEVAFLPFAVSTSKDNLTFSERAGHELVTIELNGRPCEVLFLKGRHDGAKL